MAVHLRPLLPLAALLLGAFAGEPARSLDAPCSDGLDPVLTIGWPLGREADFAQLTSRVESYYQKFAACPTRSLQINVAYGTDYELLAWIATGTVDAALLTPLAVDLARRDGAVLRQVRRWAEVEVGLEPAGASLESFFARVDELGAQGAERVFLTLPSHLSNEAQVLFEAAEAHRQAHGLAPDPFWAHLFAHLCFRPATRLGAPAEPCVLVPDEGPPPPAEMALRLSSRPLRTVGAAAEPAATATSLPEWLAVRPEVAERIFPKAPRPSERIFPKAPRPPESTFPELRSPLRELLTTPPSAELRELALPDPRLGVRSFAFTIGESLGLLEAHGQSSGRGRTALVLPGGGVKAAYQTTVLDALYGRGLLSNRTDPKAESVPAEAVEVDLVTGTSGGALVGYFVARLDQAGPFDLTCRLWFGGPGCPKALDHGDIFPPADLLRYLSLVFVFVLFSTCLSLFALRRRSPFALERLALPRAEAARYLGRPLLALSATALLVATPFAVRFVNGEAHQEHIPDVEGFVYLLLALLAMFADQCLVARVEPREPSSGRTATLGTLTAGCLALGPPLLASVAPARFETLHAIFGLTTSFAAAFWLLAPIFVVPLILARSRSLGHGTVPGAREFIFGLVEFVVFAVLALWVYSGVAAVRGVIDGLGPFLFGLLLVTTLLLFFLRPPTSEGRKIRGLDALYFGSLALAALFLIALTRPAQVGEKLGVTGWLTLGRADSQLHVNLGSLAISVGALLVFTGTLFALAAWRPRYRLENVREFASALALCLGHAAASFGLVALVAHFGGVSFFELTAEYWLALAVAALSLAIVGLFAAALFARGKLLAAFEFLASPHPNGRFRVRRHVRMVHFAVFAWGFWNLVVAPGLYGNGPAYRYLRQVALDFCRSPGTKGTCREERQFTAQLLVPANALDRGDGDDTRDGSRFFLFVPASQNCPSLPPSPVGGGRWRIFHVGPRENDCHGPAACFDLESPAGVQDMIFASGSPFPVFPAHEVMTGGPGDREFLVDGGYSNNVPIAPGQNLEIEQVLVVDSTNPRARHATGWWSAHWRWLVGSLVNNGLRLPGYLFDRAQVLDLQSRRDFFVVRIAPHPDHDDGWPFLADFRAEVVKRMRTSARADLDRRVARVESWGKPRFVRSWRTDGGR